MTTHFKDTSPLTHRRFFVRVLLAGLVIAALVVVKAGLCEQFSRLRADWILDSLVAMLGEESTSESAIAPVAWTGTDPLTFSGVPLEGGYKVELKLRSHTGRVPVQIKVDGRVVHHLEVPPAWRTHEFWLEHGGGVLEAIQPEAEPVPIHISRVKISNVIHYSEGVFNAWIVRRAAPYQPASGRAPWMPLVIGFVGALGLIAGLRTSKPGSRSAIARFSAYVCGAVIAVAVLRLLTAAWGHRLILTSGTAAFAFVLPWLVSLAWPWMRAIIIGMFKALKGSPVVAVSITIGISILVWALTLFTLTMGPFDGDIRGVARFGSLFTFPPSVDDVAPSNESGYDGQFYAVLASDPLLCNQNTIASIDNPSYRAVRGLIPFLAWTSVGGSARLGPYAYVVWCWILGLAGPFVVLFWIREYRWRLLVFGALSLNAGLVVSLTRATPDAPALTLMLVALLSAHRSVSTPITSAGGALAVLARETSVLAVPGMAWPDMVAKRWVRAAAILVTPAVALMAWRAYVHSMTGRGAGDAWTNFGPPFGWLPEKAARLVADGWDPGAIEWIGVAWVLVLIGCAASYLIWRRSLCPVLLTFLLFSALGVFLNILVYVEAYAYSRVLIVLPFLAALLLPGERWGWRRLALIAGVVLASIQGGMILEFEWDSWRHDVENTVPSHFAR